MYEVLRVARLRLALQRAFLRRAILIFTQFSSKMADWFGSSSAYYNTMLETSEEERTILQTLPEGFSFHF